MIPETTRGTFGAFRDPGPTCPQARCESRVIRVPFSVKERNSGSGHTYDTPSEKSHVTSRGQFSSTSTNVVIPTIPPQYSKGLRENYMRHLWETMSGSGDSGTGTKPTPCHIHPYPTGTPRCPAPPTGTPASHPHHSCAQSADHLTQNTPNSLNFTEVVCTLGASIPNTANVETAARPTGIATVSVGDGAWPDIGNDAPNHTSTTCPPAWRAPEGPEGQTAVPVGGSRAWPCFETTRRSASITTTPQVWGAPEGTGGRARRHLEYQRGKAAVPVGGGRAWPDNEPTHRATLAARTARGRAAAHGHRHTKQPGSASGRADPHQSPRPHRCGGHRRDRRARAGFEARHRAKRGRLASRAAGPSGARNTRGA